MKWLWPFIIVYAAGLILLGSCKRSDPPLAPPEKHASTLVLCVGGLGSDRTVILATALRARCPHAIVISVGSWNAYKVPLQPIIASYATTHRVLITHSYGAWWVTEPLPPFDYVMLLEPVNPGGNGFSWWTSTLPAPTYAARVEAFYRTRLDIERTAAITGVPPIYVTGTNHNDIAVDPGVIDRTARIINAL